MVRTLDFHSNNAGSIPASLNISTTTTTVLSPLNRTINPKIETLLPCDTSISLRVHNDFRTYYAFKFSSIITPGALTSIRLLDRKDCNPLKNKLLIKQSYMILTWVLYLRNSTLTYDERYNKRLRRPGFFIYPQKRFRFTNIKAPMAHKTFSQEQYVFKFYQLSIFFRVNSHKCTLSINKSLYFLLSQRRFYSFYGTNLFLLKRFSLLSNSADPQFLRLL